MKIQSFDEFSLNESQQQAPFVKKGEKVEVVMELFQGNPSYKVTAHDDSFFNEHSQTESFSFLSGGDMMMIARWDGKKWVSN
jgi:hypothetical protein